MAVGLALLTFVSTGFGGLFALRHRDRLHLILGFTAGVILGVVAFDVLPEISDLAEHTHTDFKIPMIALAGGFLGAAIGIVPTLWIGVALHLASSLPVLVSPLLGMRDLPRELDRTA